MPLKSHLARAAAKIRMAVRDHAVFHEGCGVAPTKDAGADVVVAILGIGAQRDRTVLEREAGDRRAGFEERAPHAGTTDNGSVRRTIARNKRHIRRHHHARRNDGGNAFVAYSRYVKRRTFGVVARKRQDRVAIVVHKIRRHRSGKRLLCGGRGKSIGGIAAVDGVGIDHTWLLGGGFGDGTGRDAREATFGEERVAVEIGCGKEREIGTK